LLEAGARWLVYLGSLFALGSAIFQLAMPAGDRHLLRPMRATVTGAALVGALASLSLISITAGKLLDDGIAGMLDTEWLGIVAGESLGTATGLRIFGLALVIVSVFVERLRTPLVIIGALGVGVSFARTGHSLDDPGGWSALLVACHLLGVAFWFGAIWPLHALAGRVHGHADAARIAERFGRQALWIVPGLMIIGVAIAWRLLGDPARLLDTEYGRMLLVKLILVGAVLGLGALNKLRMVPALGAGKPRAAHAFRTVLRIEAAGFVAVFLATALLTSATTLPGH